MKVIQVVPRIKDLSSGPSYSVPRLCGALADEGVDVRLHVLEPAPEKRIFKETRIHRSSPFLRRLGMSRDMMKTLREEARSADIMHTNSLWMMPNIYPGKAVGESRCKLVISPRGTLSEWALSISRYRKKFMWFMGQRKTLLQADLLHATSKEEYHEIRNMGLKAPIAIIPNGIDVPATLPDKKSDTDLRRLLFLSRIHPTKGVDMLIRVWARIRNEFPGWELCMAGPLNGGYAEEMQRMAAELGQERLKFLGEVTGVQRDEIYSSSDLFVLPTRSENFGVSVAEALARGLPVVVTKGAPWAEIERKDCGWWIDIGEDALGSALVRAMAEPEQKLAEMGERGRLWVGREFSWPSIVRRMIDCYRWLIEGGRVPEWIHIK